MRKTILTCAVTGNVHKPADHPGLPVTPDQIAAAALGAARAGAAIVHLHVRDPETGEGAMDLSLYREVTDRIAAASDVIVNLTTGEGGRYVPDPHDPASAGPGTTLCAPERRVAHVAALKPEICTLDFNTMVSGGARVVINTPATLEPMAATIRAAGTKPEIEIFDTGDLHMALDFIDRGLLDAPALFNFVLGIRFGCSATAETLTYLVGQLPPGSTWSAFGVGRHAFPMLALAQVMGGHVRIGMEDTLHLGRGRQARDNAELVEKAARIVTDLGGDLASPAEARAILGLPPRPG